MGPRCCGRAIARLERPTTTNPYAPRPLDTAWSVASTVDRHGERVTSSEWPTEALIESEVGRLVGELSDERRQAGGDGLSVLYVFYSGHGVRGDGSRTGLPLADTDFEATPLRNDDPGYASSMKSDWLDNYVFNTCFANDVSCVLVIDACYAGGVVAAHHDVPIVVCSSGVQVSKPVTIDGVSRSVFINEFARAVNYLADKSPDGLVSLPQVVERAGSVIGDQHGTLTGQIPRIRASRVTPANLVFARQPARLVAKARAANERLARRENDLKSLDRLASPSPPAWLAAARGLVERDTAENAAPLTDLERTSLTAFIAHAIDTGSDTSATRATAEKLWTSLEEVGFLPWRQAADALATSTAKLEAQGAPRKDWESLAAQAATLASGAPTTAELKAKEDVFRNVRAGLRRSAVADEYSKFVLVANEHKRELILENIDTHRRLLALNPVGLVTPERLAEMQKLVNDREGWLRGSEQVQALVRRATFDGRDASAAWLSDAQAALEALSRMLKDPASAEYFYGRPPAEVDDLTAAHQRTAELAAKAAKEKQSLLAVLAAGGDDATTRKAAARLSAMHAGGELAFNPLKQDEHSLLSWYTELTEGPRWVNATVVRVHNPVRINLSAWAGAAKSTANAQAITTKSPVCAVVLSQLDKVDRAVLLRVRYFNGPPGPSNRVPIGEYRVNDTAQSNAQTIPLLLPDAVLPGLPPLPSALTRRNKAAPARRWCTRG